MVGLPPLTHDRESSFLTRGRLLTKKSFSCPLLYIFQDKPERHSEVRVEVMPYGSDQPPYASQSIARR